jgi:hypothetical protein
MIALPDRAKGSSVTNRSYSLTSPKQNSFRTSKCWTNGVSSTFEAAVADRESAHIPNAIGQQPPAELAADRCDENGPIAPYSKDFFEILDRGIDVVRHLS